MLFFSNSSHSNTNYTHTPSIFASPSPTTTPNVTSPYQHQHQVETFKSRIGLADMDILEYFKNGSLYIVGMDALLFPLEVIKTITIAEKYGSSSYAKKIRSMVKKEGIQRFYRGMIPSVFGSFPGQATYFMTYESTQNLLSKSNLFSKDQSAFWPSFISGAAADMVAGSFYVPADITSQRLQIQNLNGFTHNSRLYKNSFNVIKNIIAKEGIQGMFRGYTAHIITYAPGSAVQWGTYEATRKFLMSEFKPQKESPQQYLVTSVSGAIASFCSTVVTNPLDVIRIRQQLLDTENAKDREVLKKGYFNYVKNLYEQRGLSVFFKGLPVRLSIMMPGSIVAMCGYETVKSISEL